MGQHCDVPADPNFTKMPNRTGSCPAGYVNVLKVPHLGRFPDSG